jgi:hypothetical protein
MVKKNYNGLNKYLNIMNIIYFIILLIFILYLILVYYNFLYIIKKDDLNKVNKFNYNKNKNTCLLISGQIRDNFDKVFKYQKKFIIDPLNADIFCVFSDDISPQKKKYVENIIHPKNILWVKNKKNVLNLYLLYEKIYLCNKLKINYENNNYFKYDICIRIRPDLYVKQFIDQNIINHIEKNVYYSPRVIPFINANDQFFICDTEVMNKISNFDKSNMKCKISELYLSKKLINNKIKTKSINYLCIIDKYINKSNNPFNIYNIINFCYIKNIKERYIYNLKIIYLCLYT